MLTLRIYTHEGDELVASFTGESNQDCEDQAFLYLGDDDYYAMYTEQD